MEQSEIIRIKRELKNLYWEAFKSVADIFTFALLAGYFTYTGYRLPVGHQESFELLVVYLLIRRGP